MNESAVVDRLEASLDVLPAAMVPTELVWSSIHRRRRRRSRTTGAVFSALIVLAGAGIGLLTHGDEAGPVVISASPGTAQFTQERLEGACSDLVRALHGLDIQIGAVGTLEDLSGIWVAGRGLQSDTATQAEVTAITRELLGPDVAITFRNWDDSWARMSDMSKD